MLTIKTKKKVIGNKICYNYLVIYRSVRLNTNTKDVLVRLGAASQQPEQALVDDINQALKSIRPNGICLYVPVKVQENHVEIKGNVFESTKFAQYMQGCCAGLLLAATAGHDTANRISGYFAQGQADKGVLLDAAAAVATDDALAFMVNAWGQTNRNKGLVPLARRFSPGYGDLQLSYQRVLFDLLNAKSIDIGITESYMLYPDKSVFAICGIQQREKYEQR